MKTRTGFVSNSSSSSFVILLPESFDVDNIDFSEHQEQLDYYGMEIEDIKKTLNELIDIGYIFMIPNGSEEIMLREILGDYCIATVHGAPDNNQMIIADRSAVINILNK